MSWLNRIGSSLRANWPFGRGMIVGHFVTLRRFIRTFSVGHGAVLRRHGGGDQIVDLWWKRPEHKAVPVVDQGPTTEGLFTVEYPDERLPSRERFRVLPVLIYDDEDGAVRCTSCDICAKVCPPQCIWIKQAKNSDGKVVSLPEEFYIDMDVCMNCGLCAEYCPFDAIKMDQNFELSNSERHQSHIFSLQDLLVSSAYYAATHPEAWESEEEVAERRKVEKKKKGRLAKASESSVDTSKTPEPITTTGA